jgi:hypothetical protein
MARSCSVCLHADREVIDRALVEGRSFRDVARQYGGTKDSMSRHFKGHLSPALTRVAQRREERQSERGAESALDRLERLFAKAERVLDTAEQAGQTAQQLAAIREARAVVDTIARITGELRPESGGVTINLLSSPEIQKYIVVIREVFADQPERLAIVAERLALPEAGS